MRREIIEDLSSDCPVHVPRGEREANLCTVTGTFRQGKADLPESGRIVLAVRRDSAKAFPGQIDLQVGIDSAVLGDEDVRGQRQMNLVPLHVDGQARPVIDVLHLGVGRQAGDVERYGRTVRKALLHLVAGQYFALDGGGDAFRRRRGAATG